MIHGDIDRQQVNGVIGKPFIRTLDLYVLAAGEQQAFSDQQSRRIF
jgi:hypothetical protein